MLRGALSQKGFFINSFILFWDNTRSIAEGDRKEIQHYIILQALERKLKIDK